MSTTKPKLTVKDGDVCLTPDGRLCLSTHTVTPHYTLNTWSDLCTLLRVVDPEFSDDYDGEYLDARGGALDVLIHTASIAKLGMRPPATTESYFDNRATCRSPHVMGIYHMCVLSVWRLL